MSVRRVPPPPPPGFGDEEYYRLYGRPEEYHRYRARLERKMRIEGPSGDDRDGRYRHRPRSDRHSPPEPGEEIDVNRHRSHYPPPPPDRRSHLTHGYRASRPAGGHSPGLSSLEEAELMPTRNRRFENFRVTIANESEGTPSLSGIDDDDDTDDGESDDNDSDELVEEEETRRDQSVDRSHRSLPPRPNPRPAKERLGKRIRPPSPEAEEVEVVSPISSDYEPAPAKQGRSKRGNDKSLASRRGKERNWSRSASEESEEEEDVEDVHSNKPRDRSEQRSPPQRRNGNRSGERKKSSRSDVARRRKTRSSSRESRRRRKSCSLRRRRSPSRSPNRRGRRSNDERRGGGGGRKSSSGSREGRRRRPSDTRRNGSDRHANPSAAGAPESGGTGKKRKKKKKRTGRPRTGRKRRAGDLHQDEGTIKENEEMLRRLAKKRKFRHTSESNQLQSIARLAGIEIPTPPTNQGPSASKTPYRRERRRPSSRSSSSSGSSSVSSRSSNRKRRWRHNERRGEKDRTRFKMRSDAIMAKQQARDREEDKGHRDRSSKERWKHDKYTAASPLRTKNDDDTEKAAAFGNHWTHIRSERSKERSRRSRTRSRSRSSRRKSGKGRRRSHSGSSLSSSPHSRSRSRSSSRESRRKGRDRKQQKSRRRSRSYSSSYSPSSPSHSRSSSNSSRSRSRSRSSPVAPPRRRRNAAEPAPKKSATTGAAASTTGSASTSHQSQQQTSDDKDRPGVNLETSGKLLEDTNVVNGVTVKYSEPTEARKPRIKWRLYVFKGDEELPILYIHRQSAYLLGRDRKVADIPLDHPSCSKQHAVLQYRMVPFTRADGSTGRRVSPYILDLNSANGTFLNNTKIEPQKYVQVQEKDMLKFGFSSREYVLLHDQSKECEEDDSGVE